jgi:hypothetical protein
MLEISLLQPCVLSLLAIIMINKNEVVECGLKSQKDLSLNQVSVANTCNPSSQQAETGGF